MSPELAEMRPAIDVIGTAAAAAVLIIESENVAYAVAGDVLGEHTETLIQVARATDDAPAVPDRQRSVRIGAAGKPPGLVHDDLVTAPKIPGSVQPRHRRRRRPEHEQNRQKCHDLSLWAEPAS
jgi:hypothetical protein